MANRLLTTAEVAEGIRQSAEQVHAELSNEEKERITVDMLVAYGAHLLLGPPIESRAV